MTNRYQQLGWFAYHSGTLPSQCPYQGAKAYAWRVGWSLAWAEDQARLVRQNVGRYS